MIGLSRHIKKTDPEIFEAMRSELRRQRETLEMIPSENFASEAVLEASGSVLTNKYSEGYPGKRYYAGNQFIDIVENITIERAKKLFGVPHVNVQPYSGSPANWEIHAAVCKPGDVTLGQSLPDGGHLTHGWKSSATGQFFKSVQYHVKPDGYIDIEEVRKLARENKPKLIWVGATAYAREFPFEEFGKIADEVGAYLAADVSHIAGLIVGGAHKSPADHVHIIMTTTHKTLRGPRGAMIMVTEKGLKKDPELADKIDKAVFPGSQGGPHENSIAGIAIALKEASEPAFKEHAQQIVKNAKVLADELTKRGFKLVTGGTENHLLLIDLTPLGKGKGAFAQDALEAAGIIVNKNTIPHDPSSPFYPSGIRLGTPAITTRGMKEKEMVEIAGMISEAVEQIKGYDLPDDKEARSREIKRVKAELQANKIIKSVKERTLAICNRFPLYPELKFE